MEPERPFKDGVIRLSSSDLPFLRFNVRGKFETLTHVLIRAHVCCLSVSRCKYCVVCCGKTPRGESEHHVSLRTFVVNGFLTSHCAAEFQIIES